MDKNLHLMTIITSWVYIELHYTEFHNVWLHEFMITVAIIPQ